MSTTDSIAIFAEGTFTEQIRELVNYLARSRPEAEQAAFIVPFQEILRRGDGNEPIELDEAKRREAIGRVVDTVTGFGEGSSREIEGFFNLLFAHFLTLFDLESAETRKRVDTLLQTLTSSPTESAIKYRTYSNLFNAIPRHSALRLSVYSTLLSLASENDELDVLAISSEDVDQWLSEWQITEEEKLAFLQSLETAFTRAHDAQGAYKYALAHAKLVPSGSSEAQSVAARVIASALQLPSLFDFDPILQLDVVSAATSHPLHALLQIFVGEGLPEYQSWVTANGAVVSEHSLNTTELERKIRLLTLASLAFENVGKDLSYTSIAASLQIGEAEVERWVIDSLRAGLVGGRLSQIHRNLNVVRATPRNFGPGQWEILEQRLLAWQTGLAGVIDVVMAAQKAGGRPSVVVEAKEAAA